jgi:hypothetical protein
MSVSVAKPVDFDLVSRVSSMLENSTSTAFIYKTSQLWAVSYKPTTSSKGAAGYLNELLGRDDCCVAWMRLGVGSWVGTRGLNT